MGYILRRKIDQETNEQCRVIYWLNRQYPNVKTIISPIVKFGNTTQRIVHGKIMKGMGYQAGSPDLLILVARRGFHGLAIELKTLTGRTSKEQLDFLNWLMEEGYLAKVCRGADEAIRTIDEYLRVE